MCNAVEKKPTTQYYMAENESEKTESARSGAYRQDIIRMLIGEPVNVYIYYKYIYIYRPKPDNKNGGALPKRYAK